MIDKRTGSIFVGSILIAFIAGKYSAPESEKSKREITALTIENRDLKKSLSESHARERESEKLKTTTQIQYPNGKILTRTKETSKSASRALSTKTSDTHLMTDKVSDVKSVEEKEVTYRRGGLFSLHALIPIDHFSTSPVYGASFMVPIIGPLNFGLDLFLDARIGVQVGWGF